MTQLERLWGHKVEWMLCLYHIGELPFKKLIKSLDGDTTGPESYAANSCLWLVKSDHVTWTLASDWFIVIHSDYLTLILAYLPLIGWEWLCNLYTGLWLVPRDYVTSILASDWWLFNLDDVQPQYHLFYYHLNLCDCGFQVPLDHSSLMLSRWISTEDSLVSSFPRWSVLMRSSMVSPQIRRLWWAWLEWSALELSLRILSSMHLAKCTMQGIFFCCSTVDLKYCPLIGQLVSNCALIGWWTF